VPNYIKGDTLKTIYFRTLSGFIAPIDKCGKQKKASVAVMRAGQVVVSNDRISGGGEKGHIRKSGRGGLYRSGHLWPWSAFQPDSHLIIWCFFRSICFTKNIKLTVDNQYLPFIGNNNSLFPKSTRKNLFKHPGSHFERRVEAVGNDRALLFFLGNPSTKNFPIKWHPTYQTRPELSTYKYF
jgi:hypothetical protein